MKLNPLAKRLLRWIDARYPLAAPETDEGPIVIRGDRALPTRPDIANAFKKHTPSEVDDSIKILLNYQYIKNFYLWGPSEYERMTDRAKKPIDCPVRPLGTGADAYQVTEFGKKTIEASSIKKKLIFKLIYDNFSSPIGSWIWWLIGSLIVLTGTWFSCPQKIEKPADNKQQIPKIEPK